MTRVYLHAIQPAAMHGDDGALNIYEVVLAQICCPFNASAYQYPPRGASYLIETPADSTMTFRRDRAAVLGVAKAGFVA